MYENTKQNQGFQTLIFLNKNFLKNFKIPQQMFKKKVLNNLQIFF